MVRVFVYIQELLSVTVYEYVPAATFERSSDVSPLLQLYVYGEVPPFIVISMDPVRSP